MCCAHVCYFHHMWLAVKTFTAMSACSSNNVECDSCSHRLLCVNGLPCRSSSTAVLSCVIDYMAFTAKCLVDIFVISDKVVETPLNAMLRRVSMMGNIHTTYCPPCQFRCFSTLQFARFTLFYRHMWDSYTPTACVLSLLAVGCDHLIFISFGCNHASFTSIDWNHSFTSFG